MSAMRILLIESCPRRAERFRKLLRESGIAAEFSLAPSIDAAFELLDSREFDAALLGVDGLEEKISAAILRYRRRGERPAILALTENAEEEIARKSVEAGAQDCLALGRIDGEGLARSLRLAIKRHRKRLALEREVRRYRGIIQASPVGIHVYELAQTGRLVFKGANPSAESMLGRDRKGRLGRPIQLAFPELASEEMREQFEAVAQHGENWHGEEIVYESDGRSVVLDMRVYRISPREIALAFLDVTKRKRAEMALRESEARIRTISDAALDGLAMTDSAGRVIFWNPAAQAMTGYAGADILGRDINEILISAAEDGERECPLLRFLEARDGGSSGHREVSIQRKDGTEFTAEIALSSIRAGRGYGSVILIRDITGRKSMEEELRRLATTDPLTGACNRRHFIKTAEEELSRARRYRRPCSMLMLDIDHFKKINDTFGHDAGDRALKALTAACLAALRNTDHFGRLGGEEFAALLPETTGRAALDVAERLRLALANIRVDSDSGTIQYTVSIGATELREGEDALEDMLKRADEALYEAKNTGRNRVAVR
ncbi:MAG: putative diguanylate cyclase YdaM [candidate division BRC1 bacterium ADurb.BinA364]|nr:MAG: putative diguanylate cyclase YdaM [candidate division BRC1 bacterium ADurb.BinA364]